MPTPRPIMLATAVDQSGTSMTAASRPTAAEEMPRPKSAVTIGSPAAISVPKVSTSTSAAIIRPTASEDSAACCALVMTWPPISTRSPSRPASCASEIRRLPVVTGTLSGRSVSDRRDTAIVPSREISGGAAAPMPSRREAAVSSAPVRS
ncbi:MAG: hypothetical protein ABI611_19205 [Solirubrobacteraceae bacterium]